MALLIVEDLIGIAGDVDLRNNVTRICVEYDKLRWNAASDKQSVIRFIKPHRKISEGEIGFPYCSDFAFVAIDYRDMARIGNVYENSLAAFFQFERFGMGRKFD